MRYAACGTSGSAWGVERGYCMMIGGPKRNEDSKDLPEDERFTSNMADIAEVWRRGSVISSWPLCLGAAALSQ